jgi:glycosyltransferase involved in cell wall biosynthesis
VWREVIEGHRCGLTVDPFDSKAFAQAIEWILDHPVEAEAMGARGRVAVQKNYCWDVEASKLLSLYERILANSSSGRA